VIVNNAGALNTTTPNAVTMNGGILRLNGNSVTISSLSGSSGMVNNTAAGNLTLTVNQAGNTAFGGVLANGGAGTLALQKTGAGTLTLSGANTYTGGTTLSAGHLALSSDNVLPNTGTFTFAGGILDANSHTDTIGPLSLTASSTLNLSPGGASGTLTFASMTASAATVWTINGWSGVANTTGTDDHIILSANPGATVLGQIHFADYADGALYLLGGEIVPVPEPSNIALGIFGAVVALFGIRQRLRSQARRPA
jgi:autotransporter-associated beta strand protein